MGERERLDKPPIKAIYEQGAPNEPIDFGSIEVLFPERDQPSRCVIAQVQLRFTPKESLRLTIPPHPAQSLFRRLTESYRGISEGVLQVSLPQFGTSIDVFCVSESTANSIYVPTRSPVQLRPESTSITCVTFHLFNWPDLHGAKVGRNLYFVIDGWQIVITANDKTDAMVKALKKEGGHALTHVGSVQRTNGAPFSTNEVDDLLGFLCYFFSFSLGKWSAPSLAVGVDDCESRVYEQWGLGRVADGSWRPACSWLDGMHSQVLPDVASGFWGVWNSEVWHKPLRDIIYWYVSANEAGLGRGVGVDSALLFTQAAFELLSWTYCVTDKQTHSKSKFKSLSAASKIRELMLLLKIPTEIPSCLIALQAAQSSLGWLDSMHALTDLRNDLVHPEKVSPLPNGVYFDAWKLSMWYIELALLRLCEYEGKYANRLGSRVSGQVETVPWRV